VRVHLIKPDLQMIDWAITDPAALSKALGCVVIDEWFVFPGALLHTKEAVETDPASLRWGSRLFLLDDPRELVGLGGFKGAPRNGEVEVGYAVAPTREGRGIATAALIELIDEAFTDPQVSTILADTLPDGRASQRVLEKTGFTRDGTGPPHDGIATIRFRLDRR
jgi:ribosomal-protein-alanine N-acetyltransferase